MTTYTFIPKTTTQSVSWNDPSIWAGGVVPNSSDADVIFSTVTRPSDGSIYKSEISLPSITILVHSISLTNNGIDVGDSNLSVGGDVSLQGGSLELFNGTLSATDLSAQAGGAIEMSATSAVLSVGSLENGTEIQGFGQINVSGMLTNTSEIIGRGLTITAGALNNIGQLIAASGDLTVNVSSGGFTNLSGSTLTGGTYQAGGDLGGFNSTIYLNVGSVIVGDAATIVLNDSEIASFDGNTNTYVPLESSLQSITSSGTLSLSGRTFNWGNLTDDGALILSAATLNAPQLIIGSEGQVSGFGTINASITNDGVIIAGSLGQSTRAGLKNLNRTLSGVSA